MTGFYVIGISVMKELEAMFTKHVAASLEIIPSFSLELLFYFW